MKRYVSRWLGVGLVVLIACDGSKDVATDPDTDPLGESDTEVAGETDPPETDAPDTEAPDTDAPDTDPADTDPPETDAPHTDVETDAPDTDDTDDSDLVDTDDTDPPFLGINPGTYTFNAARRWMITPGTATSSNVMLLWMTIEVDAWGVVTGEMFNSWTINESTVIATCAHDVAGSVQYAPGANATTVQVTLDTIGDFDCDNPPDSPYQQAWTDAMRGNFGWIGLVALGDVDPAWEYQDGSNVSTSLYDQVGLGLDVQFLALVEGTGDYFLPDTDISPNAFFGAVERR